MTPIDRPGPPPDGPLLAAHVVAALAERLAEDTILVEEAPSTRPEILARIAVRSPMGFVAVANGALGFGLASAIGLRMAVPERPVLALLGDGSSTYSIQALWSAAHYGVGVVFVVIGNGSYAIMDQLAGAHGAPGAWPSFGSLDLATVATRARLPVAADREPRRARPDARRGDPGPRRPHGAAAAGRPRRRLEPVDRNSPVRQALASAGKRAGGLTNE